MRTRSLTFVASLAAWVFGIATSVLFVGIWGRAVVVDTDALADDLRPMGQSEQVAGMFRDWIAEELGDAGVPAGTAADATEAALVSSEVEIALEGLVVAVVEAAASQGVEGGTVDVAAELRPAIPSITRSLTQSGVPVTEDQVAIAVGSIDPLVIREPGQAPVIGNGSPLAGRLGTAVALAIAALLIFGAAYVTAHEDRAKAIRTLLTRFALTGLSFAVLLRLSSWVLDPGGGRAPLSASLSMIAQSKWLIPLIMGAVAGIFALISWLGRSQPATPSIAKPAVVTRTGPGGSKPQTG